MNNNFTREARYVVLKSADVMKCLTVSELIELRRIQAKVEEHRAEFGKPPLDCVVVESDWPEYEPTWKAIEARTTGTQVPKEAIAKILTEVMDIAVSNGADSRSMPDEYVEVAAWLCGMPAQNVPSVARARLVGLVEKMKEWEVKS